MTGWARWVGCTVSAAVLFLTGCSLSPASRLTLFPEGHRLIDAAKAIRAANAEPPPLPRELHKTVLPVYVVEPGDGLLIQPVDLDSPVRLPGDQVVLPDGTIQLGKYGRLQVAGKSVEDIERDVRALIQSQTKDAGVITVRLVNRQSKVYYVLGEVNAPGAFPYNGRETVLDGILAAGGLTDRASRRDIILARPTPPDHGRVVLPVCYREIVQLGDTTTNYQLAPGDRIYVATRGFCEGMCHCGEKDDCAWCNKAQVPAATCPPFGQPIPEERPIPLPPPK
jgi:protein involved in polysaccharide export with SLBB domain